MFEPCRGRREGLGRWPSDDRPKWPTARVVHPLVHLVNPAPGYRVAGKLNFYVNVVDDRLRTDDEASTIGLLLCRTRKSYFSKTFCGGRREAERELARLVAEVEAGSTTAAAGTVAELCNKWFEYACPNLSPAVSAEYRATTCSSPTPSYCSKPSPRSSKARPSTACGASRSPSGCRPGRCST